MGEMVTTIDSKTVAPNVEIVWNPQDNSGLVRFIAQTYTTFEGGIVGGAVPAGMEERTFAHLAALGFDVAGVMQQFKDAFDAVWAERVASQAGTVGVGPMPDPGPEA